MTPTRMNNAESFSLREQVVKERMDEDRATSSIETAEPLELVKARLTELSERLTGAGGATVSKRAAR